MATSVTWNGTTYSIPADGEIGWASLSDFLIALGNNAAVAEEGKQAIRIATTSPVSVSATTDYTVVTDLGVAGAVAVNLPAGVPGQMFFIVDGKGDAGTNNITITPAAGTIGGAATLVLNHNREGCLLQYPNTGTDWKIVGRFIAPGTITSADITGTIAPSKGGTGVNNNDAATLTRSGNHALTLTTTAATGVTLPTTGTLATLDGSEILTNKTISGASNTITNVSLTAGVTGILPAPNGGTGVNNNVAATLTRSGNHDLAITTTAPTTVTMPVTGTLATLAGSETFTNKTISGASNTISNLPATAITTGEVALARGGTGFSASSTADLFNQLDPLTTKGDLIARTTTDSVRLPVGVDGQVLTARAAAAQGVAWENSGAGGSGEINAISNPNAASDTTGWTVGTGHTITRISTVSTDLLSPIITTAFRVTNSSATAESSTSGANFAITLPNTLENRLLKVQFYVSVPSTNVWRLSVYDGTTRLPLTTDASGATTLPPGFVGTFTTYFVTTSNNSYSVNFTGTTGTGTNLDYTNVIVGPGIQAQGAVFSYLGSLSGLTVSNNGAKTFTIRNQAWRNGNLLYMTFSLNGNATASGSTATTSFALNLPSGYTIDSSALNDPSVLGADRNILGFSTGFNIVNTNNFDSAFEVIPNTTTSIRFTRPTTSSVVRTVDLNVAADQVFTGTVKIPIAEWAGSGNVNLAQNDGEFASNSGTSTTTDTGTTNFAYGPAGSPIRAFAPSGLTAVTKRIGFTSPIQDTDQLFFEVSTANGGWAPAGQSSNVPTTYYRNDAGTTAFGVLWRRVSGQPNQLDVEFYSAPTAGDTWSGATAFNWRVRKVASGQAVGFGAATATQSGLVRGGTVPGQVSGAAIASGFIGETVSATPIQVTATGYNSAAVTASVSITAGIWLITATACGRNGTRPTGAGITSLGWDLFNSTSSTILVQQPYVAFHNNTASVSDSEYGAGALSTVVNLSASATIQLRVKCEEANAGTGTPTAISFAFGQLRATRIA